MARCDGRDEVHRSIVVGDGRVVAAGMPNERVLVHDAWRPFAGRGRNVEERDVNGG